MAPPPRKSGGLPTPRPPARVVKAGRRGGGMRGVDLPDGHRGGRHRPAAKPRAPRPAVACRPDPGTDEPGNGRLLDRAPCLALPAPADPFSRLPAALGAPEGRRRL